MSDQEKKKNPQALIGTGFCFITAGLAITFALRDSILGAGMGLFGLGVVFLIAGIGLKRKKEASGMGSGKDSRSP
ncbi:MAG: hypothetical protein GF355_15060 [Candidatus Eisenbacteria bacterium]|nr:hypothetical protein [Candidatus Eisenbacteria bacterium]